MPRIDALRLAISCLMGLFKSKAEIRDDLFQLQFDRIGILLMASRPALLSSGRANPGQCSCSLLRQRAFDGSFNDPFPFRDQFLVEFFAASEASELKLDIHVRLESRPPDKVPRHVDDLNRVPGPDEKPTQQLGLLIIRSAWT